ncbi:hypothetical protein ASG01_07800 [Chryseobacterium sp. Leaf180]|nr:hypothetical protein ASG01_07800 [Chryseobacterium sp. Leaf180]
MTKNKIISSFAIAVFSTFFVGGIFYLTDLRFTNETTHERMFSWGFVTIYFIGIFIGHLFMDQIVNFFKNIFTNKSKYSKIVKK